MSLTPNQAEKANCIKNIEEYFIKTHQEYQKSKETSKNVDIESTLFNARKTLEAVCDYIILHKSPPLGKEVLNGKKNGHKQHQHQPIPTTAIQAGKITLWYRIEIIASHNFFCFKKSKETNMYNLYFQIIRYGGNVGSHNKENENDNATLYDCGVVYIHLAKIIEWFYPTTYSQKTPSWFNECQKQLNDNNTVVIEPEISEKFKVDFIENLGANFLHPQGTLKLKDIFVAPNLQPADKDKNKIKKYYSLENVANTVNEEDNIKFVILGEQASGKTTIIKYLFNYYFNKEFIPIIIKSDKLPANNQRIERFEKIIEDTLKEQYEKGLKYSQIDTKKIVIIIDDFDKSNIDTSFKNTFIQNIEKKFKNIILTGNTLMPFGELTNKNSNYNIINTFDLYVIAEFGDKLRNDLVNKWNSFNSNIDTDTNEFLRKNDFSNRHISTIIGKNFIPSFPFYILGMLQSLENSHSINTHNYSQHGFYYQLLIDNSLNSAVKNTSDISFYIQYITEFCYHLFVNKQKEICLDDFIIFDKEYKYTKNLPYKTILETFKMAKIFDVQDGVLKISHRYIYYFFVAKYFANNINKKEKLIKTSISKMCQRLYQEEFSNIIMFLTHLSPEEFIIEELLRNAKEIFANTPIAEMGKDLQGINELITELPAQILENIKAKEAREKELNFNDEIKKTETENIEAEYITNEYNLDEGLDTIDEISKITNAIKTIEILGQVAKKYWGQLEPKVLYLLTETAYFLTLRTLNNYFNFIKDNQAPLIQEISNLIDKKFIKDSFPIDRNIEKLASSFVFKLCFLTSFGLIRKVSNSIGNYNLSDVISNILKQNNHISIHLIDLSIKLDFYKKFPIEEIQGLAEKLKNNKLGFLVLRNLVINYLYLFNVEVKRKQQLCTLLKIEMKSLIIIDGTSNVKK